MKTFQIYWTFVKSFFVCQHFASDLSVNRLLTKFNDAEAIEDEKRGSMLGFEHWNCECRCKCGEKVTRRFALSLYLGDPTTRYPMRSEYNLEDE